MENEAMQQVMIFASIISPFVAGIVEVLKRAMKLPKNFIPLISAAVGALIGFAGYPFTDMDTVMRIWAGVGAGLAGTGIFELITKREGFSKTLKEK